MPGLTRVDDQGNPKPTAQDLSRMKGYHAIKKGDHLAVSPPPLRPFANLFTNALERKESNHE